MNLDEMIEEVIAREGDYVNHPADRGGPTRWGITEAVARPQGYAGDMRKLPREEAAAIYRRLYWLKPGYDRVAGLAPEVAAELFDTAVNMGPDVATGFFQRALNALNRCGRDYPDLVVDRKIGPKTLGALAAFLKLRGAGGKAVLLKALNALQGERYIALAESRPANEVFLYGWLAERVA
jgi:lysozyme family protein